MEPERPQGPHVVVFDLETMRSAAEVGGWDKAQLMGMSVGVVWDSRLGEFRSYFAEQAEALVEHLRQAELVVGFNIAGFDYRVLAGYSPFDFRQLNTLDILQEVYTRLKHRVSLDALIRATLNRGKTADGLQALQWYKEGRLDLIEQYCRQDVEATRDLFQCGLEQGYLLFDRKDQARLRVPVGWNLEELAARKKSRS